jgi:hypothetical protein
MPYMSALRLLVALTCHSRYLNRRETSCNIDQKHEPELSELRETNAVLPKKRVTYQAQVRRDGCSLPAQIRKLKEAWPAHNKSLPSYAHDNAQSIISSSTILRLNKIVLLIM